MPSRTVSDASPLRRRVPLGLLLLLGLGPATLLAAAQPADAQPAGRPLGIGAHVGEPTGLAVRFYDRPGAAFDLLAAFDLNDDDFFMSAHRVWEQPLQGAPGGFFHGPGLFASTAEDDGAAGIGYTGGLGLSFGRLGIFLQLAPRLRLLPGTDFALGGGAGLRYYFSS